MYPTARERKERGSDRCWSTQAPRLMVGFGRLYSAVSFVLANFVRLSLGPLVWVPRLFVRLLVRLQNEGRALCGLHAPDGFITQRDFPSLPTTLRRVRLRSARSFSTTKCSKSRRQIHSPLGWAVSIFFGLIYGFKLKDHWEQFALYWYQPGTTFHDPIFGKSLGFYLFSLPLYDALSSWLLGVTFIILVAALLIQPRTSPDSLKPSVRWSSGAAFRAVCCALALFLLVSWRTYLSRFPFSGRTTRRFRA